MTGFRLARRLTWPGRGAALAAMAIAASSCGLSLQSLPHLDSLSGPFYHVKAVFSNVENLPANAQVREGAFQVGYVSNIAADDFHAIVTMAIKKSVTLPAGTSMQVRFDTPLGDDFIAVVVPTNLTANAPPIKPGSTIPETLPNGQPGTLTAPSLEDVLGALGALLNGGGLNQLHTIINESVNVVHGNVPQLRALLNELSDTVTTFASSAPTFDRALQSINTLSQTLNQSSSTIVAGISNIAPAVGVLEQNTGSLRQLLDQVSQLSTVANNIVVNSQTGTVESIQALQPLLDQLVGVQQELGPALGAIDTFLRLTPRAVPGDYLQSAITANVQVPDVLKPCGTNTAGAYSNPPTCSLDLNKILVDPPDPNLSYNKSAIATILEGGLP
jgi:phospholipid/cholesterol/gamma-HCH transport system substrate-binding protein